MNLPAPDRPDVARSPKGIFPGADQEHGGLLLIGIRYMRGFVGKEAAQDQLLAKKVEEWLSLVDITAGVAGKHPQTAYAGMQKYLQQEWDFVQRVTLDISMELHPIEDTLRNVFFPALFKGPISQIPGRVVTGLPIQQDGIFLPYPPQTAISNWMVSCVIKGKLAAALLRTAEFWLGDHELLIRKGRDETRRRHAEDAETALVAARADSSTEDALQMGRITQMGA